MIKLIFLFTVIPLLELGILIKLSQHLGLVVTIGLVAITGILGALLAKQQRTTVVHKIKRSIAQGQMPADELIDGLLILVGSVCLITPGLLTDITGFLCILPATRPKIKALTRSKFKNLITTGKFEFKPDNDDKTQSVDIDYSDDQSDS